MDEISSLNRSATGSATIADSSSSSTIFDAVSDASDSASNSIMSPFSNMITKLEDQYKNIYAEKLGVSSVGSGSGKGESAESYLARTLHGVKTGYYGIGGGLTNGFHRGVDIGARGGSSILSPISGTVVSTGYDAAGYGNYAVVRSRDGKTHIFGHMRDTTVGYGDHVDTGSLLGTVGSTGNSSGNHLHYEIRTGDSKYTAMDPAKYKLRNIKDNAMDDNVIGSGGSNKDLPNNQETINKLNIAVNTDGVENKLDILIDVMKDWAMRDSKTSRVTNTNNMYVGSGKGSSAPKTVNIVTTNQSQKSTDYEKMDLRKMHEIIAKN